MSNFIDPAMVVELDALSLQKPMNDVIDRGDSAIQQLYSGMSVLITGGSGFVGKHLIEKLLRACNIKKVFVLIRSKKELTIQKRINDILKNPVYDTLRKKKPDFAEHVVPIEGNISELRLGLSDADWKLLTEEVNVIFHAAATIRFNESLRGATLTNVRGTREMLQLAKECKNLLQFVHVSTAFAQATKENIKKDIPEKFYACPVPPHTLISLAENVEEKRLNKITTKLIGEWPNTYTFTKAIAEELVRINAGDLPACIIRPPMVTPALYEPSPGWLDFSTLLGPSGLLFAAILGVVHTILINTSVEIAIAPIDIVNNATIASVWDSIEKKKAGEKNIPIYTIARQDRFITFATNAFAKAIFDFCFIIIMALCSCYLYRKGDAVKICKYTALNNLRVREDLHTPKLLWNFGGYEVKYLYLYNVIALFLHYIPAYILDIILDILGKKPKEINSCVDIYRKLDKSLVFYDYFLRNEWYYRDDNVQTMMKKMNRADQAIFNCNLMTMDVTNYVNIWRIGIRKYIIKDGLQGSAEGERRHNIFKVINLFVGSLYAYVVWWICSTVFTILAKIFV